MDDAKKNEQDWKTQIMLAELLLSQTPVDPKTVDRWWQDIEVVRPEYREIQQEAAKYMSLLKGVERTPRLDHRHCHAQTRHTLTDSV